VTTRRGIGFEFALLDPVEDRRVGDVAEPGCLSGRQRGRLYQFPDYSNAITAMLGAPIDEFDDSEAFAIIAVWRNDGQWENGPMRS
jgi:hypothetical protein